MPRLTDNLNSKYIESRNALNRRRGKIIEAFVENEMDVPFWSTLFNEFGLNRVNVCPISKSKSDRGKESVLKRVKDVGEYLLLCVDSDYDYLLNGATATSKTILENPYVFQTYTYSTENYQCYAQALHHVVVQATLTDDRKVFDIELFMQEYAKTIYPIFVYAFHLEEQFLLNPTTTHPYPIKTFCTDIALPTIFNIKDNGAPVLKKLKADLKTKMNTLPAVDAKSLKKTRSALLALGVTPENTYLFVQGHAILEKVTLRVLKPVIEHFRTKQFQAFDAMEDRKVAADKRNEFEKQTIKVETILKLHTRYLSSTFIRKIEDDMRQYEQLHPLKAQ